MRRRNVIAAVALGVGCTFLAQTLVGGGQSLEPLSGPPPTPRPRASPSRAAAPEPAATSRPVEGFLTGLEPTPEPTPAPPLTAEEEKSLRSSRQEHEGLKNYDLSYTAGMPECHPRCQLPDLGWRATGPPGRQRDQFGTLLQWDTENWGNRTFPARVACLVAIGPRQRALWEVIADSWGRHCDELFFVFSTAEEEEAEKHKDPRWSFLLVPMRRPDNDIHGSNKRRTNFWEKVWRMWLRASNELVTKFDWFYKGDSDTFASVPNLRRFVQFYNPDQAVYLGHTHLQRWRRENGFFNAGCGYVLSKGALRRVGHVLRHIKTTQLPQSWGSHCVDRPGAGEDITFSFCLRAAGVPPQNTLDRRLRQRFLTFQYNDHRTHMPYPKKNPEDDYFWAGKPAGIGSLQDCCADEPIIFHNYKGATKKTYWELEHQFGASESKPVEVPPRPQCFLFDDSGKQPNAIPTEYDEHRNVAAPPAGQVVFRRPGELSCGKPDWSEFTPSR